ncbi:hypothetical protein BDF14DRAFT_1862857 [Spinellus fusiger]|nr:hypothetical protein BDF14DRAFT_1862857 [Spinellus fusiger]
MCWVGLFVVFCFIYSVYPMVACLSYVYFDTNPPQHISKCTIFISQCLMRRWKVQSASSVFVPSYPALFLTLFLLHPTVSQLYQSRDRPLVCCAVIYPHPKIFEIEREIHGE